MSGKKLINNPDEAVEEALEGLTFLNPGLRLVKGHGVVLREKVREQVKKLTFLEGTSRKIT